jgi:hypothetical protein
MCSWSRPGIAVATKNTMHHDARSLVDIMESTFEYKPKVVSRSVRVTVLKTQRVKHREDDNYEYA